MKTPSPSRPRPGPKPKMDKAKAAPRPRAQPANDPDAPDTGLIGLLEDIARDETAPAASRTAAARAVLEARGQLGKHQQAPGTGQDARPLVDLSRTELEAELARLRLHFAASLTKKT